MKRGTLLVVSGFSGAGKGTVLSKVLEKRTDLYYSVSFTTRAPRTGEQDGVNYHFVTREAFQERIDRGEFLEYAEYVGNFYGTSMAVIREKLDQGVDVILQTCDETGLGAFEACNEKGVYCIGYTSDQSSFVS